MSKKIGLIAAFLVAVCLSYFTTKLIVNLKNNKEGEVITCGGDGVLVPDNIPIPTTGSDADSQTGSSSDSMQTLKPDPISEKIVLSGSKPIYDDNNKTYSFTSKFSGNVTDSYHFELWSNKLVSNSKNGKFTNIPPIKGGKYKLCLVSEATGKNITSPISVRGFDVVENVSADGDSNENSKEISGDNKEKPQKKLITEEEFQRRMLDRSDHSLDGGRRSVVTKGFRVVVSNANPDDGSSDVSDIQDVRDMIHTYNKWKDARVVELVYDETGHVTLAKVQAVY